MANDLLIDTGFLYALFDEGDPDHRAVVAVTEMRSRNALVPDVVLVEATFLALRDGGIHDVIAFLRAFESHDFHLQSLEDEDITRAREIMETYDTAELDFVDCCVMALSERLTILTVCTIDPNDFRIFRPKHCEYLEILPPQL